MRSSFRYAINLLFVIFVILVPGRCAKDGSWKGNVVIITLDTTRADHIGSYGYENAYTPNIDRLAREGIRFENCYSSLPLTLPSHCNIFTGRYSIGHGVRNNGRYVLDHSETTLAEYLKQKGYHTFAAIASFVLQSKFGLDQGFDVYDDAMDSGNMHKTFKSENNAAEIYEKFDKWITDRSDSKFFAWIHFYDPHTPYLPHEEFPKENDGDLIKLYDGEISFTDKYIGKIMDKLEEIGVTDDTLVVLVGDHGEAFGEHNEFASHMIFCYEANLRVPLIFYNKNLFGKSRTVRERVDTIDLMPTILDYTGIEKSGDIQGVSLKKAIETGKEKADRTLYVESMYGKEELNWAPLTGVIDGNYKYISLPKPELYDIKKDPLEKDNLFRKKGLISREMDEKLKKMILEFSGKGENSKRELGKQDLEHLRALGYISSFGGKGGGSVIDPKDGIVLNVKLKKISAELENGDLNQIEKELEEIRSTELGKENFLVYDFLYRVHMKKNKESEAMSILREAIRVLPHSIPFRLNFATRLFDMKEFDKVIENCNQIINEDPLFTRAYIILAETYDILRDRENSDKNYGKALELEPENLSLQIQYSEKLLREKRYPEVLKIYDSLLAYTDAGTDSELLYKIALFNTQYGSVKKSAEILSGITRQKPEGKYFYYYALIMARLGDRENAIKNMRIALSTYGSELTPDQISTAKRSLEAWQ